MDSAVSPFERLFHSDNSARDNFRSRLFGLFSEEIVRYWCANERASYEDLGRPTLWCDGAYATVDFTLRSRADGRCYAAEMKAEMAFERYRYLRLTDSSQLSHHTPVRAFSWLVELAADAASHSVRVGAKAMSVDGAILIWGATTTEGRASVIARFGFADVLSVEAMLQDLRAWNDPAWQARVGELRTWADGLLDGLS